MKFIVNNRELLLEMDSNDKLPNSGSIKDYLIDVEFSEEWDGLTKVAKICIDEENEGIERGVIDDKVYIDMNEHKNYAIGFIGYTLENNKKVFQKSTNLRVIPYPKGAGEISATEEEVPTPSQWEVYIAQLEQISDEAAESARAAANSATIATEQAGIATENAEIASISATTASEQAEIATTKAGVATTKANEASTSATKAKTSENNASNSASAASESATSAETSANSASQSATNASNSAETASNKADEAESSANSASQSASSALESKKDAEDLITGFNSTVETATTNFNTNATNKLNEYNNNASDKLEAYNTNATEKTTTFNENATQKTNDFNENAQEKLDEFNENAESYNNRITELESENKSLKAQIPTGTAIGESITLNDSAGDINWESIKTNGKTEQDGTPTPETQVEIKNVAGKNLFDKNNPNLFYSYIVIDGNITFPSDGGDKNQCIYIPCKSNITYTVQKKLGERFAVAYTYNIPAQGVSGYGAITGYSNESITITTDNNAKYLVVYVRNGNISGELTLEEALNSIQIEEGSVATPYVPYNSIEFKVENKNLFNAQKAVKDSNNSDTYISNDGKWIRFVTGPKRMYFYPEGIKENTRYTLKTTIKSSTSSTSIIEFEAFYTDGTSSVLNGYKTSDTNEHTVTGTTLANKTLAYIRTGYNSTYETFLKIDGTQLEEGILATNIVAHQEQTKYFTFEEGQYLAEGGYLADDGIHNVYAQKSLNGTENWASAGTAREFYAYYLQISDIKSVGSHPSNNFWCDSIHFVRSPSYAEEGGGYLILRNFVIFSSESSVNDFKTWLSNHNMILQYELENPQPTPYTPTQQAQWEAIKKMKTYKNVSYISTEGGTLEPSNDVVYYKDLETMFNEQDKIKQAIIALGGVI